MAERFKQITRGFFSVLSVLVLIAVFLLTSQTVQASIYEHLQQVLRDNFGLHIAASSVSFELRTSTLAIEDVLVGQKDSRPLFTAKRMEVSVDLIRSALGRWIINTVRIVEPEVRVIFANGEPVNLPRIFLGESTAPAGQNAAPPSIPKFFLDLFSIENARIHWVDEGAASAAIENVSLTIRKLSNEYGEFEFRTGAALYDSADLHLPLKRLILEGQFTQATLILDRLDLDTGKLRLTANGQTQVSDPLRFDAKWSVDADLTLLQEILPRAPKALGTLSVKGRTDNSNHAWASTVEIRGRGLDVDNYFIGDVDVIADGDYITRLAHFRKIRVAQAGGAVDLKGRMKLHGDFEHQIEGGVRGVQFATMLRHLKVPNCPVNWSLTGDWTLIGRIRNGDYSLLGDVQAKLPDFVVLKDGWEANPKAPPVLKLPLTEVRGRVEIKPDRINILSGTRVSFRKTNIGVNGFIGFIATREIPEGPGMKLHADSGEFHGEDIEELANLAMKGEGELRDVSIEGPFEDLNIQGRANMRNFRFLNFVLGNVQSQVQYRNLLLAFSDVTGRKNMTSYGGNMEVRFASDTLAGQLTVGSDPHHPAAKGAAVGRLEDVLAMAGMDPSIRQLLHGNLHANVLVNGPMTMPGVLGSAVLTDVAAGEQHLDWAAVRVRFEDRQFHLERFVVKEGEAVIRASGVLRNLNELDFTIVSENLQMLNVHYLRNRDIQLHAGADLIASITGTLDNPDVFARLNITHLTYNAFALPDVTIAVNHVDGRWMASSNLFSERNPLSLFVYPEQNWLYRLDAWFDQTPIHPWIPARDGGGDSPAVVGAVDGRLFALGHLADITNSSGWLSLDSAVLDPGGSQFTMPPPHEMKPWEYPASYHDAGGAAPPVQSALLIQFGDHFLLDERHRITVHPFWLHSESQLAVTDSRRGVFEEMPMDERCYTTPMYPLCLGADGALAWNGAAGFRDRFANFDLNVRGKAELALLQPFVRELGEVSGMINVDTTIANVLVSPAILGSGRIQRGQFTARDMKLEVSRIEGPLQFSENSINFTGITASSGGGLIAIDGEIQLESLKPSMVDVRANLRRVETFIPEWLPAQVSGDLNLVTIPAPQGQSSDSELGMAMAAQDREKLPMNLLLKGDLKVDRISYTQELDSRARKSRPVRNSAEGPSAMELRLDLDIRADKTIELKNSLVEGTLSCDLKITGDAGEPAIKGTLSSNTGELKFRDAVWTVTSGELTFDGGAKFNPGVRLRAETERRNYKISMMVTGTADKLDPPVFTSNPPGLSEQDIFLLLALGLTTADAQNLGASGVGGFGLEFLSQFSGIEGTLKRFMDVEAVRLTSRYSDHSKSVEPRLQVQFRPAKKVRVSVSSSIVNLEDRNAQVEYRLSDIASLRGEYDTGGDRSYPNLGLDLKFRWEFR
ncbi:MAG: hypothetical protein GMKNLPBB_01832 [Myxococcota bacterium]|nr:hypothetical protein [Myxococcota bacterium]